VDADRFTQLDRMLIAEQQGNEFADLRTDQDMRDTFRQNRALLIGRARKLERMGLATEVETGQWIVSPKAEPALRELGERGEQRREPGLARPFGRLIHPGEIGWRDDPALFFRGKNASLLKILFWDGTGLCLFTKRIDRAKFMWPRATEPGGTVMLTPAQLAMLIEGIDWRAGALLAPASPG
jgi:hypothetical protein